MTSDGVASEMGVGADAAGAVNARTGSVTADVTNPRGRVRDEAVEDVAGHDPEDWDVAGLIRRVRRVCDLSQAELAGRLGVAQSTVARWESGQREPSLGQFRVLVKLARWRLRVCAADGTEVRPMDADGPRDRRNRRVPAHLEVVPFWPYAPRPTRCAEQHWFVPKRRFRDVWRKHCYGGRSPKDHLSQDHVRALVAVAVATRRRYYRAFWEQSIAAAVARGESDPREPPPLCSCPTECEDVPGCIPGCGCLCEVVEVEPGTPEGVARALAISASMRSLRRSAVTTKTPGV